jgi:hypothetical protein
VVLGGIVWLVRRRSPKRPKEPPLPAQPGSLE